jgi:hypothetical protein
MSHGTPMDDLPPSPPLPEARVTVGAIVLPTRGHPIPRDGASTQQKQRRRGRDVPASLHVALGGGIDFELGLLDIALNTLPRSVVIGIRRRELAALKTYIDGASLVVPAISEMRDTAQIVAPWLANDEQAGKGRIPPASISRSAAQKRLAGSSWKRGVLGDLGTGASGRNASISANDAPRLAA